MPVFVYLCPDMAKSKQYIFNKETLSYEVRKRSKWSRMLRAMALVGSSMALAVFYMWLYTSVFGAELPKTAILKRENAEWRSKVEVMNVRLEEYDKALTTLQLRDDDIYRSIFGMNEIPAAVRNAGYGGVNRYSHYDEVDPDGLLKRTAVRLDVLSKKSCVQSKSFDELAQLSKRAGEMASCIPAIPPMNPRFL